MGNRRFLADTDLARIIAKDRGISVDVVREVLKGLSDAITRLEPDTIQIYNLTFYLQTQEVIVYVKRYT